MNDRVQITERYRLSEYIQSQDRMAWSWLENLTIGDLDVFDQHPEIGDAYAGFLKGETSLHVDVNTSD